MSFNFLWVDDERPAPEGWVWAKTSDFAVGCLTWLGPSAWDIMSLDHDLGGPDTTRRVVLWLCERDDGWPTQVRVHSANPVGVQWLEGMVTRYAPEGTLGRW